MGQLSVLPTGAAGKHGLLRLTLGPRAGRTTLLAARQRVPLHIGRVLYPQPEWPELAQLLISMPTGGLVEGDRVELEVVAEPGTVAHLTSQSANRAYRCGSGGIEQTIRLELRGPAYLEWWPDLLIPYAGTNFRQIVELVSDPRATLLFADSFAIGRLARGEANAYRSLRFTTLATDPAGRPLFRDSLRLEPARRRPAALGLLGDARYVGTFYLLGPNLSARLEEPLAVALKQTGPALTAVTRLPHEAGLLVRALLQTSKQLREVQDLVLATARSCLRGRQLAPSPKM